MIGSDLALIATAALFVAAWWWHRLRARRALLWASAAVLLAAGAYGVGVDRWQAGAGIAAGLVFVLALLATARRPPRGLPYVSGSLLALAGALAVAAIVAFPVSPLPAPGGPHAVGLRSFELTDPTRRGVLGAAADAPRRLLVRVWYPAVPAPGATPRPYFSEREAQTTARAFGGVMGFAPLLAHLRHLQTNAFEDAPLATGHGKRPVVFFSHGYAGYVAGHSALMEHLASHGYVIFSVQHTGDASPTVFPDGEVAPMDPGLVDHLRHGLAHGFPQVMVSGYTAPDFDQRLDGQLRTATEIPAPANRAIAISAPVWVADRLFVHDALQAGAAPPNVADIVAASDFSRTGEAGISFGGSTSGAVCLVDPRCAAAVNLDGGDFDFRPFDADLPVPLLMFHADLRSFYRMMGVSPEGELRSFNDFSYERFDNAGQRADHYRMQLRQSAHAGLTDASLFLRRPLRDALFGAAPTQILVGAPNDFVLGFLDRYLRGMDNGFPQPQYRQYAGWVQPYDNAAVRRWWQAKPADERAALEQRIARMKAARAAP